jgi:hypothetical protein
MKVIRGAVVSDRMVVGFTTRSQPRRSLTFIQMTDIFKKYFQIGLNVRKKFKESF